MQPLPITIKTLLYEPDRPAHIARHGITLAQIGEVLEGSYIVIPGKDDRYVALGQAGGQLLAVVIGARDEPNTYGLITARVASRKERRIYQELIEGADNGTN